MQGRHITVALESGVGLGEHTMTFIAGASNAVDAKGPKPIDAPACRRVELRKNQGYNQVQRGV